jgi:hypothetical protein
MDPVAEAAVVEDSYQRDPPAAAPRAGLRGVDLAVLYVLRTVYRGMTYSLQPLIYVPDESGHILMTRFIRIRINNSGWRE